MYFYLPPFSEAVPPVTQVGRVFNMLQQMILNYDFSASTSQLAGMSLLPGPILCSAGDQTQASRMLQSTPPAEPYPQPWNSPWMYIGGLTNAVWWEMLGNFLLFPRHPDHSTLLQHKPHSQCSPWQMPELTSLLEMLGRGRLDEDEVERTSTTDQKRRNTGVSCQLTLFPKIKIMKSFTQPSGTWKRPPNSSDASSQRNVLPFPG